VAAPSKTPAKAASAQVEKEEYTISFNPPNKCDQEAREEKRREEGRREGKERKGKEREEE